MLGQVGMMTDLIDFVKSWTVTHNDTDPDAIAAEVGLQ
jgi:hypothetical protein